MWYWSWEFQGFAVNKQPLWKSLTCKAAIKPAWGCLFVRPSKISRSDLGAIGMINVLEVHKAHNIFAKYKRYKRKGGEEGKRTSIFWAFAPILFWKYSYLILYYIFDIFSPKKRYNFVIYAHVIVLIIPHHIERQKRALHNSVWWLGKTRLSD